MNSLHSWEGPLAKETNEEYHKRIQYSSSQIKYAAKSGWHFKRFVNDGIGSTTTSMSFGTLAHECIFEDKLDNYSVLPKFSPIETTEMGKRGKPIKKTITAKSQEEAFIEANKHLSLIGESDYQKLQGMKYAFEQDKLVQSFIFEDDLIEQGYAYYDEENDIECRFRADRININQGHIIDYKTCADASPEKFKWSILNYGYDVSAAHYMLGGYRLFPDKIKSFIFIAQETKEPYACAVYKLSNIDLMVAIEYRSALINKIKRWNKLNYYPGYTEDLEDISLPATQTNTMMEENHETQEFEQAGL